MNLIEARGIAVEREARRVLDGVDFTFGAGELVGIVGPNGAGKTTLLRSLLGLQKTCAGEVRFEGDSLSALPRRELAQAVGYLPQNAAFHWPIVVERAVSMGRFPHQPPLFGMTPQDRGAIERAMDTAGINTLATRRVDRLSGGECMRVHLARLLAGEHRGIIADEPFTSLDARYQLHFLSVLKRQVAAGISVLISLHDLSLAARFCDRIVVLKEGRVAANDAPDRALDEATLAAVFEVTAERLHTAEGLSIVPTRLLEQPKPAPDQNR